MELTANNVLTVLGECTWWDDGEDWDDTDLVEIEGIIHRYEFSYAKIEEHHTDIRDMLGQLPYPFHQDKGGGWSFLNACNRQDGTQWTGLHVAMDQLFCLGMAARWVTAVLPRDLWSALPGGMPYYTVLTERQNYISLPPNQDE